MDTYEQTARLRLPEPVKVTVAGFEIGFVDWPGGSQSRTETKIGRQSWIHFSNQQERPFDEWLELVRHLQNFLTLMMDRPTFPIAVRGRSEAARLVLRDDEKPLHSPIGILYQQAWPQPEVDSFHQGHMLFPLSTLEEQLVSYLTNWIDSAETLRPVHNLYFSNLYNPYLYQESEFLSLTQALETYHRRKFGGQYQSNDEYRSGLYRKFVEIIPADLEPGFRESLKAGTLKYANEYSLIKRLKEITSRLSDSLAAVDFLRTREARNAFAERVRALRNYLTHYDPNEEIEVPPTELFQLTRRLELLTKICLLQDVGLSAEEIGKAMRGRARYRDLLT